MGATLTTNMMGRSILVAIALIACVHAIPTPNDIVPETAATSAHASAKQIVTEMIQAGSDWNACSELANTTRDEVEAHVKAEQHMLDEVNRTLTEMHAASNAVTVAETVLETATNAQVQLSSRSFQSLQAGECGWIVTDSSYQTAHVTYTTAVTTLATTRTTYTLSVTEHTEKVIEAARLKLECECATQSAHAAAWANANEDNDANEAAWDQAHHIDCVIERISEASCTFGPAPSLTQPALCDDIESVSCAAESGSAGPVAPPTDETSITDETSTSNETSTTHETSTTLETFTTTDLTNAPLICPAGYTAIQYNLDGTGKVWSQPHPEPSRTVAACGHICDARTGCTGFEYAEGPSEHGACGTYTGGQDNVHADEGRLNEGSNWRSCLKE